MASSFSRDIGAFLPTTTVFDTSSIQGLDVNSAEFKNFLVDLLQTVNNIALIMNIKESAYYYEQEFVTGGVYFPNPALNSTTAQTPTGRQVIRKVVNFGTLPNAGSTSVAHGITVGSTLEATRIYGAATDPSTNLIPIPFSSPTLNENIKIVLDGTNITITTAIDYSGYTSCFIVIEYIEG